MDAYLALVRKRDNHDPIALGQDQVGLASVRALELGHQGEQGFRDTATGIRSRARRLLERNPAPGAGWVTP